MRRGGTRMSRRRSLRRRRDPAARFAELWTDSVILHTALTFDFEAEDPYISGTVLCEKEIGINQQIFVEKISD